MNTFLFACLCWRKKITLEKQVNFYKPHAVFKLIYTNDMQVALALKVHAIWLVFEISRFDLFQIALETRDYLYKLLRKLLTKFRLEWIKCLWA